VRVQAATTRAHVLGGEVVVWCAERASACSLDLLALVGADNDERSPPACLGLCGGGVGRERRE